MNRFLNTFRRMLQTRPAAAQRGHTFRPQLEQLDQRLLPSISSAISIQHSCGTERAWYSSEPGTLPTDQVLEFKDTTPHPLSHTLGIGGKFLGLSASIDPNTGSAEVFALRYRIYYATPGWSAYAGKNAL